MFTLVIHPLVADDYNEAFLWYESKQEGLGERFLNAVRNKLEMIAASPQTFGSKTSKKYREASVDIFPFIIVFKVDKRKGKVYILSIHHTKKHPSKKFRKFPR